ncbi:restriction endonuclease [Escherichia coli]|nr:restriction endonuclease [Escherichia coli]
MIWQPEFTDKTLSRKPGAVHLDSVEAGKLTLRELIDTLAKDKNYKASKWDQRYREFTTLLQQTLTFAEPETDV